MRCISAVLRGEIGDRAAEFAAVPCDRAWKSSRMSDWRKAFVGWEVGIWHGNGETWNLRGERGDDLA